MVLPCCYLCQIFFPQNFRFLSPIFSISHVIFPRCSDFFIFFKFLYPVLFSSNIQSVSSVGDRLFWSFVFSLLIVAWTIDWSSQDETLTEGRLLKNEWKSQIEKGNFEKISNFFNLKKNHSRRSFLPQMQYRDFLRVISLCFPNFLVGTFLKLTGLCETRILSEFSSLMNHDRFSLYLPIRQEAMTVLSGFSWLTSNWKITDNGCS